MKECGYASPWSRIRSVALVPRFRLNNLKHSRHTKVGGKPNARIQWESDGDVKYPVGPSHHYFVNGFPCRPTMSHEY